MAARFGCSIGPGAGSTPPELGIVPQEVALYPLLTARENLEAFGRLQGLSGAVLDRQVDWVLERTGLADRAAEPIKQFSGGMRRRLNIACGIVHRPRVVLLDEPTVGVDPQSRDRIYDVLAELRSTACRCCSRRIISRKPKRDARARSSSITARSSPRERCRSSSIRPSAGTGS